MEKINNIILFTTCYLVFYIVGAELDVLPDLFILLLFIGSPIVVLYMAFKILKDGQVPEGSFDDGFWYEDRPRIESAVEKSIDR
jgi:hypothetical protein